MIRYHVYVKGRPAIYRLDWKLTLADYLGANELMESEVYPGGKSLNQNPLEGDRAAIQNLTRQQRDRLGQVIVNLFNPNAAQSSNLPAVQPNPQPQPSASPNPLPQAQPGDARLLLP
jgi:hypothetical protein